MTRPQAPAIETDLMAHVANAYEQTRHYDLSIFQRLILAFLSLLCYLSYHFARMVSSPSIKNNETDTFDTHDCYPGPTESIAVVIPAFIRDTIHVHQLTRLIQCLTKSSHLT